MTLPPSLRLFDAGYRDLVSIVPPGASILPQSGLKPEGLGKAPGWKKGGGWVGYSWTKHQPTREEVAQWTQDGANIGLRGDNFPMLDIDLLDAEMVNAIAALAEDALGWSPRRTGRAPKALFPYRLDGEPFSRVALVVQQGEQKLGAVEWLGQGRQAVVLGQHPSGAQYTWDTPLWSIRPEAFLPQVNVEQAIALLNEVKEYLEKHYAVVCTLQGVSQAQASADQESLRAPSLEQLTEVIKALPNREPDRAQYISIAAAIKASWPDDPAATFSLFADWAARWEGGVNAPEIVKRDWESLHPPYRSGWPTLLFKAQASGTAVASIDFQPVDIPQPPPPVAPTTTTDPNYSEQSLAHYVADELIDHVRWVAEEKKWRVWLGGKWGRDTIQEAPKRIAQALARYADLLPVSSGVAAKVRELKSQSKRSAVTAFATDILAVEPRSFDQDPAILNTPGGILDLTTGTITPHDPTRLCSLQTSVTPDYEMATPVWNQFLDEVTLGREALKGYLQRIAGYLLTSSVDEQTIFYFFGVGGNGKGVWTNTLEEILGDYASKASENLITSDGRGQHEEATAMLDRKRFLLVEEAPKGDWNEERLKHFSGGSRLSARHMYGERFEFNPTFKCVILGNNLPAFSTGDAAMQRRLQIMPWDFKVTPETRDGQLQEKLRPEYPGILAWALRGLEQYRRDRLSPPQEVLDFTAQFFAVQDPFTTFLATQFVEDRDAKLTFSTIYNLWHMWARGRGLKVGTITELKLLWKKWTPPGWDATVNNEPGWGGLKIREETA